MELKKMKDIREDFPILNKKINGKRLIYFDNACSILKPKSVINAINYYYTHLGACAGERTSYSISRKTDELCEKSRFKTQKFIGAKSASEIIWTKNATESINLIANSLDYSKRNKIILSSNSHHSLLLPFYEQIKKKKIKLKIIDCNKNGQISSEKLKEVVDNKTALVGITHASNVTGRVEDLKSFCEISQDKGALVLSDSSQFVSHHKLDVLKNNVDFLAFSAHKLGGPTGLGILYGKEEASKNLSNFIVGGNTIKTVDYFNNSLSVNYSNQPKRFEAGLQNYSGIIGFGELVKYLEKVGLGNIEEYEKILSAYFLKKISSLKDVIVFDDSNNKIRNPTFSFKLKKDVSPKDFSIYLNELPKNEFAIRTGTHCANPLHQALGMDYKKGEGSIRASLFAYNTKEEINLFFEALSSFLDLIR
ncbi:aminotransferase class V-fold PLP-dependent enzyme [Candidatus Woesearchaeota archaeon]|nr:aminotransferase class V-fold PLP-dependent enzyme [Candidatus Woesearchaeota archaeon]